MSEIIDRWRAGEGLPGCLVIDGHTHIMAWPYGVDHSTPEEGVAQAVAAMDANGVDAACVMSGGYMFAGLDYTVGNDVLLEMTRMAPERLIAFGHINPNDTWERIEAELERIYAMGFRCLKLLNDYQDRYPGDGPNLMALYQFAAERNMLVFNHMWLPGELPKIAREFPSVDLICGPLPWLRTRAPTAGVPQRLHESRVDTQPGLPGAGRTECGGAQVPDGLRWLHGPSLPRNRPRRVRGHPRRRQAADPGRNAGATARQGGRRTSGVEGKARGGFLTSSGHQTSSVNGGNQSRWQTGAVGKGSSRSIPGGVGKPRWHPK